MKYKLEHRKYLINNYLKDRNKDKHFIDEPVYNELQLYIKNNLVCLKQHKLIAISDRYKSFYLSHYRLYGKIILCNNINKTFKINPYHRNQIINILGIYFLRKNKTHSMMMNNVHINNMLRDILNKYYNKDYKVIDGFMDIEELYEDFKIVEV